MTTTSLDPGAWTVICPVLDCDAEFDHTLKRITDSNVLTLSHSGAEDSTWISFRLTSMDPTPPLHEKVSAEIDLRTRFSGEIVSEHATPINRNDKIDNRKKMRFIAVCFNVNSQLGITNI